MTELFNDNTGKEIILPSTDIVPAEDTSCYWDISKSWEKNAFMDFITGSRGLGKTYGALQRCYEEYMANGSTMVYVRQNHLDTAKVGGGLFDKHISKGAIPELVKYVQGKYYICQGSTRDTLVSDTTPEDWKIFCYNVPLSMYLKYKSTTFVNTKTIIFDEFINEKGKYLPNEVEMLLSLIETIFRGDDDGTRVYCLANGFSIYNPYFMYFGIAPDRSSKTGITHFKDKSILIEEVNAEKFIQMKRANTRFGRLIDGTPYGDFMLSNANIGDNYRNINEFKEPYFRLKDSGKFVMGSDYYNVFRVIDSRLKRDTQDRVMIKKTNNKTITPDTVNLTNDLIAGIPIASFRSYIMTQVMVAKNEGELYFADKKTASLLQNIL